MLAVIVYIANIWKIFQLPNDSWKIFKIFFSMIVERIKDYIDYLQISVARAEELAGIKPSTLSKAIKNGKAIGTDKLENFLIAFPLLSPEWLLRGTGEMEKSSGIPDDITNYALIKDQQRTISRLLDRIDELEGKKEAGQNVG